MAVFSGMIGVTIFGVFLTPVFFYVIDSAERVALVRARRRLRAAGDLVLGILS